MDEIVVQSLGEGWAARLAAALASLDAHDPASLSSGRTVAAAAHRAMIEADKEGRAQDALAIAAGLDPFAQAAYAADPGSQHAIWNDYGALLYEHGDRDFAISVLRSAWAAHQAWTQSDDRRDGIKTKQQVGLLNTLGTLVSALTSVGDFDDAEQFRQLGASTAFDLSMQGYNEAYTFLIAGGQLLAAQGRTGEAENVLTQHLRAAEVLPALRMPLFRVAMFLASIYVRRRRFDLARQSLERAGQLIDSARFVQDAADLQQAWAVLWHKLSADDIQSAAWRNAAAANQEASRLRASSPRVSPSAGCAEEALFAIMALKENRIVEGRRYLARALRLARTVWTLDDLALQNPLLTSAGFALVAGRPAKALSRTRRLIRRLDRHEAGDREALLTVLPVHAEALRRLGDLAGAANALEYVLDIESDLVTAAIVPNWSPHDVALVRRGHETLNLFVDAALAAGAMRDPHQLFARIAATKDLGLRTLRMKRGAAPPELKRSTLADDLARALPKGAGYVEFFIHTPRLPGGLRTTWGPGRLLAFTLNGRGRTSLKLHDLGPANAVAKSVGRLAAAGEGERRRLLAQAAKVLQPVIQAAAQETVFIAPDGFLHALPFAALPRAKGRWIQHARIALVESAAVLLQRDPDGGAPIGATVVTAGDVGSPAPYGPLPAAIAEGEAVGALLGAEPIHLPTIVGAADELRTALRRPRGVFHLASHADVVDGPRGRPWSADRVEMLQAQCDPYAQSLIICGGFNDWARGGGSLSDLQQVSVSAAELASFDLRQLRLMTFGACNGAVGGTAPLESSASLATAARAAGAGAVVAALWPVPDQETRLLMSNLYWLEPATGSSVEALRQSQLELLDRGLGAWASFVVWAGPDDLARLRRRPR